MGRGSVAAMTRAGAVLALVAALFLAPLTTFAQPFAPPGPSTPGIRAPVECTVAEVISLVCSPELNGVRIVIIDAATPTECGNLGDAGLGGGENVCRWSALAAAWIPDSGGVAGGAGETNTHSSDGGGLAITAALPKVGIDLRLVSLAAADFDLAADVITIDATKWAELTDLHLETHTVASHSDSIFTTQVQLPDGTFGAPSLVWSSDLNTGFYQAVPGDGGVSVSCNGQRCALFDINRNFTTDNSILVHGQQTGSALVNIGRDVGIGSPTDGALRLNDDTGVGSFVQVDVPDEVFTDWFLTLPNNKGTNLQLFQTDGEGNASWVDAPSGGEVNTHSSDGVGLAITAATPKVLADLRLVSLAAADFDLAADVVTIDATKWAELTDLHPETHTIASHSTQVDLGADVSGTLPGSSVTIATIGAAGVSTLATQAEVDAGAETSDVVVPFTLHRKPLLGDVTGTFAVTVVESNHSGTAHHADEAAASESVAGVLELATQPETDAGADDARAVTALKLGNYALVGGELAGDIDTPTVAATHSGTAHHADEAAATELVAGILELATQPETDAGLDDARAVTPLKLGNYALAGGELGGDIDTPTVNATHGGTAHHAEAHTVASHSDTTGTGPELDTLTDTSNSDGLHVHASAGISGIVDADVAGGANIASSKLAADVLLEADVGDGLSVTGGTINTESDEAGFIDSIGGGPLTCGASTFGRMAVSNFDVLEYCDATATEAHHYIADADSAGLITDFSNAADLDAAGEVADDSHDHTAGLTGYLPLTGGELKQPGDFAVEGRRHGEAAPALITLMVQNGLDITMTSTAHGLAVGEDLVIRGTINYNGAEVVQAVTADTFDITETWVTDQSDANSVWNRVRVLPLANGAPDVKGGSRFVGPSSITANYDDFSWGCDDFWDTGGPPQTSCAASAPCHDNLCDSDGTTNANADEFGQVISIDIRATTVFHCSTSTELVCGTANISLSNQDWIEFTSRQSVTGGGENPGVLWQMTGIQKNDEHYDGNFLHEINPRIFGVTHADDIITRGFLGLGEPEYFPEADPTPNVAQGQLFYSFECNDAFDAHCVDVFNSRFGSPCTDGNFECSGSSNGFCDFDGSTSTAALPQRVGAADTFCDADGTTSFPHATIAPVTILNFYGGQDGQVIKVVTSTDEGCTDLFNAGGPPENTGNPNGLCDSDGSTLLNHLIFDCTTVCTDVFQTCGTPGGNCVEDTTAGSNGNCDAFSDFLVVNTPHLICGDVDVATLEDYPSEWVLDRTDDRWRLHGLETFSDAVKVGLNSDNTITGDNNFTGASDFTSGTADVATAAPDDSDTSAASTAFVQQEIGDLHPIDLETDVTGTLSGLNVDAATVIARGTMEIGTTSEINAFTPNRAMDPFFFKSAAMTGELGGTYQSMTVNASHSGSAHHADAHTVASHSDTTGTGPELDTLTDASNADALHVHTDTGHPVVADHIDAITEVATAIKSGIDLKLITGTATTGQCAEFDVNGDIIGAGGACGVAGGESNTHSSDGGGLAITAATPKVGVDLRLVSLAAADFDLTTDVVTIDATKWAELTDLHAEAHTVASHSDTTGTGPELDTLTDASNADALHTHGSAGIDADSLVAADVHASLDTRTGFQLLVPSPNPTNDEFLIVLPPFTGTMTKVRCEAFGGTNVIINICDGEDLGDDTCTTSILDAVASTTLTCTTSPSDDDALNATGFVAYDKLSVVLVSESGNVDQLSIVLTVEVD